jgi:acyl transferase domain-containing protein/NAD(P)H-dependent flavin oxidoreductase YrpB (nitropropane dioxygenase family)/NADP-dependent 3-hydroxy acid dehydrogenase YdfG
MPDVKLALAAIGAGAFPILHLGRDLARAQAALREMAAASPARFGVCLACDAVAGAVLPPEAALVLAPLGLDLSRNKSIGAGMEILWQAHSIEEAQSAASGALWPAGGAGGSGAASAAGAAGGSAGAQSLVIKGSEGAGRVADESSFIIFQKIAADCAKNKIRLYIQGGAGVHTSAAYLALGASGVIFDSQAALFPECGAPAQAKDALRKLSGSETILVGGFRALSRTNSPQLPAGAGFEDLLPYLGGFDLSACYLPAGQDAALAADYAERYRSLPAFVYAVREAARAHLAQAAAHRAISRGGGLAEALGTEYPITQGPMARISDVPAFLRCVADEGALPVAALSMMGGEQAKALLDQSAEALGGKPWGVGILGFAYHKLVEEQTALIVAAKPAAVVIAGGRPAQAKPFEKAGIKAFLHVPAAGLLDVFLKEGARRFVFEGRESGGHVGPLDSCVLWEKQINRLLREDSLADAEILFAGGIHDAFSSAFVSVMAAPLSARSARIGLQLGSAYMYTREIADTGAITKTYQRELVRQAGTVLLKAAPGQETRALRSPFTDFFGEQKRRLLASGADAQEAWVQLEAINLGRLRIAAKGLERRGGELAALTEAEQLEGGLFMAGAVAPLIGGLTTIKSLHAHVADGGEKLVSRLASRLASKLARGPAPSPVPKPGARRASPPAPPPTPGAERLPGYQPCDVAIVGMECVFPFARDRHEYWRNILFGADCVTEVPDSRWDKEIFYNPDVRDTDYVVSKWGGFMPASDFDAQEFGITPQSLLSIEPVQLLSLLVAKRALQDAGYSDLGKVDMSETSVIFGAQGAGELTASYCSRAGLKQLSGGLPEELAESLPKLTEDSFPGVLSNVIAGRITNRLDIGGRNYTVDAACASSLAALDIACMELAAGRSEMVVLGGADAHNGIYDFLMFSSTYALSKKGRSATFDSEADGIALGEGIGVVVLKRLRDAERDGNKIYAVIKGVGGGSDGKSLGLTAPNRKGQAKTLRRAYENAGIRPSQVGLIEAHGTGTTVGDRIELGALTDVFVESGALPAQTRVGSVKSQIGHTKCAAGLAGLIKAALAVRHGLLPQTLHLKKPIDAYFGGSPFAFNAEKTGLWGDERRIAGVSGFGFGGANFHAILENYGPWNSGIGAGLGGGLPGLAGREGAPALAGEPTEGEAASVSAWPAELFLFRGDTPGEAEGLMQKARELLLANDSIRERHVARSLAAYSGKPVQCAIVAADRADLLRKIGMALGEAGAAAGAPAGGGQKAGAEGGSGEAGAGAGQKAGAAGAGDGSPAVAGASGAAGAAAGTPAGAHAGAAAGLSPEALRAAGIYRLSPVGGKTAFLFSGQGSQRVNMARDLFVVFPSMRRILDACLEGAGGGYEKLLFPDSAFTEGERREQQRLVTDTRNAQPLLGIVDYAIAELLREFGVEPDMVAGHSYGELPALCCAGVFGPDRLTALSRARAESILGAIGEGEDCGKMIAASLSQEELEPLLEGEREVWAVNYNAPKQISVAGTTAGLGAFMKKLDARKASYKELSVACAFHSPLLAKAPALFAEVLGGESFSEPALPVWSNTTAGRYPESPGAIKERLCEHLARPVLFSRQLAAMHEDGARVFVEAGPGGVLCGLASRVFGRDAAGVAIIQPEKEERGGKDGFTRLLHALAQYAATGRELNVGRLFEGRGAEILDLDDPARYKRRSTVWRIDGEQSVPASGIMPPGAPKTFEGKITLLAGDGGNGGGNGNNAGGDGEGANNSSGGSGDNVSGGSESEYYRSGDNDMGQNEKAAFDRTEDVMLSYLDNMNAMMQNQRDVMMGYLGDPGVAARQALRGRAPRFAPQAAMYGGGQAAPGGEYAQYQQGAGYAPGAGYGPYAGGFGGYGYGYGAAPQGYPVPQGYADPAQAAAYAAAYGGAAYAGEGAAGYAADAAYAAEYGAGAAPGTAEAPGAAATPPGYGEGQGAPGYGEAAAGGEAADAADGAPDGGGADGAAAAAPDGGDGGGQPQLPRIDELGIGQIKDIILGVVSENTGYPIDMLDLDVDLEADLSIDSIKRLEIISALREKMAFPEEDEVSVDAFEKMVSIKTLNGMISWIEEIGSQVSGGGGAAAADGADGAAAGGQDPAGGVAGVAGAAGTGGANGKAYAAPAGAGGAAAGGYAAAAEPVIVRLALEIEPYPLGAASEDIGGKSFAITDDGAGISSAIAKSLEGMGAKADLIRTGSAGDLSAYDGLLLVNASASPEHYTAPDLFRLLKAADMGKLAWVCAFDDTLSALASLPALPGSPGRQPAPAAAWGADGGAAEAFGRIEGFPGFIKTLRFEYPKTNFRVVSSYTPFGAGTAPAIVAGELRVREAFPEILYDGAERLRYRPVGEAARGGNAGGDGGGGGGGSRDSGARGAFAASCRGLEPGSVSNILVIGGGQGIAPVLAARLARDYPCRYILAGRSQRDEALAAQYSGFGSPDAIRKHLISSEGMKKPKQIEERLTAILKARGIEESLRAVGAAGGSPSYHSVDARDGAAFRRFISDIRQQYGSIDGVMHAAGILEDKLFSDKSLASFERTYRTKAEPLKAIAQELLPGLKLLVLFSSMASAFGNRGQCDYAAGNSVLDVAAGALARVSPDTTVKVFDWGPWGGAGMVSAGLESAFRKRGIAPIGLEEGGEFFAGEIRRGGAARVIAIAADEAQAASFLEAAFGLAAAAE